MDERKQYDYNLSPFIWSDIEKKILRKNGFIDDTKKRKEQLKPLISMVQDKRILWE